MKTVEIHHVDRKCRASTPWTFPVRWSSAGGVCATDILGTRTITGREADLLQRLFEKAFVPLEDNTLCGHYPNYGLRCFDGDALILETTVCLSCANWIGAVAGGAERFCIAPEIFGELSSELQRLVPLSADESAELERVSEMQRALQDQSGRKA